MSLSQASGGGTEVALNDYIAALTNAPENKLSIYKTLQNPKLPKVAGVAALPLSYTIGVAMIPRR